jgi:hypothetical protein
MESNDLDSARVFYPGMNLGSYSVIVPWNHMTVQDWKNAAANAHDLVHTLTRDIAWLHSVEAIKFVYCNGSLVAVLYLMAQNVNCGRGYKGHGMTDTEKTLLERFFFEVADGDISSHYIYKRKSSQPT